MWSDEADLDTAQQRVDAWQSSFTQRAERAAALSRRLAELTATAHSVDRLVEITVDGSGTMTDLRLDERTRQQSATRTAQQILTTTRAAHAELLRQVRAATVDALGADDPAGQRIIDGYARRLPAPGAGSGVD